MSVLFDITDPVARPLGGVRDAVESLYANSDFTYDVAVGGLPFLLATSEKYPLERALAQARKEQLDTSPTPGEQSFSDWWLRSQASFHAGAGINYLEPSGDDPTPARFAASRGVDVWTKGQVTLLRDTDEIHSAPGATARAVGYDVDGAPFLLISTDENVYRHTGLTGTAATWGGTGTVLALCEDGTSAYIADAVGIYKMALSGGDGSLLFDTGSANVALGYVKQRLVAGIGNSIYELLSSGSGGPALPTPIYSHPDTDWQWTAVAEGPSAIYVAGKAGARSAIHFFTIDDGGAVPVLSSALVAAELPTGEVVESLQSYLGAYLAIGTNRGVRIGIMETDGTVQYGPLTVETDYPVRAFTARDRFIYAGVQEFIDGRSGLVRIDLGEETEPGRYAWATDLAGTETGEVSSVVLFGTADRIAFSSGGYAFLEAESRLVADGYIDSGQVRFSTLEPKRFASARVRGLTAGGQLVVSSVQRDGDVTSLANYADGSDLEEATAVVPRTPVESLAIRVGLVRSEDDTSAGPTLYGFQLKAAPVIDPGELIRLPLMCYDHETNSRNQKRGTDGSAWARFQDLMDLVKGAGVFSFQDLRTGEVRQVKPEDLQMAQVSQRAGRSTGFGGVVYLTVKTVDD